VRAVRSVDGVPVTVDVPVPGGPWTAVSVASVGICGSDLHLVGLGSPAVLGHEFAGVTADGRLVAVEPLVPCGGCPACLRGDVQLCRRAGAGILGVGIDGGMAQTCRAPETSLVPLPDGLAVRDAGLVEPTAIAVHGLARASVQAGERICVIGGGTIGLTALVAGQAAGARVDVVARHAHQRSAAARLGAEDVDPAGGGDYDLVVEAAGSPAALAEALTRTRPGGRVLVLGNYWDPLVEVDTTPLTRREVSIIPSRMYGRTAGVRDFETAAGLLAARPDVPPVLITHRFGLEQAAEAFRVAGDRRSGSIKVVIEPAGPDGPGR
jgi:2-desacetyl-2-hydroxyethyl bacteriochlorophyllide A dehydrogenase